MDNLQNMTLPELREKLSEKESEKQNLDKVEVSEITDEQLDKYETIKKDIVDLKAAITRKEQKEQFAKERVISMAAGNNGVESVSESKEEGKLKAASDKEFGRAAYEHFVAGKELTGAIKEMHQEAENYDGVSHKGIAIPGKWLSLKEYENRQANKAVIDQANSALTPTSVADSYVEAIREVAIYPQVGATVYENLNGEDFKIPVAGKITAAHASAENANASDGGAQFAPITLQADRITTYADLSNKINLQNGDIAMRAVMSEIGRAVAETINDAMFPTTTLSNAPTSIAATSGVGTFTEAGTYAAPSNTTPGSVHADLVTALVTLTKADALQGNLAYVASPELMTDLIKAAAIVGVSPALGGAARVGNSGQSVNGYPIFFTNSATSSAGTSGDFIFGNFRKVHVGFFGSLVIQQDVYTQNLKNVTRLVAHRYYDFKLAQGAAFVKATSLSA